MYKFLENLMNIDSPSGYTHNAINYIEQEFNNLGFTTKRTKIGNLYLTINGKSEKNYGFSGHTDTLGLMVKSINSDGTLSFTKIGGPILSTLNGEYCKIYTRNNKIIEGTIIAKARAIHVHPDAQTTKLDEDTMMIRIDALINSKEDVLNLGIQNGDFICIEPKFRMNETFINSRFLDNKLAIAIFYKFLKKIKEENLELKHNTTFIISTNEEIGYGCAHIPVPLDALFAIDMACIGLDLDGNEQKVTICPKDSGGPYNYELTSLLINKAQNLNYAIDIYPRYSSDATAAIKAGNDIPIALFGPGVDASHGMERAGIKGIEETFKLLVNLLI